MSLWVRDDFSLDTVKEGCEGLDEAAELCTIAGWPQRSEAPVLVYAYWGASLDGASLGDYVTLASAFAAAVRKNYQPSMWCTDPTYPARPLDQADHWRSMMLRGLL